MKKFLISESEKERILGMHKKAIRKEWVISEANGGDFGERMADANIRSISGYEMDETSEPGNAMVIALNDINGNQLYYNCITDPRLSKKDVESSPSYSAGYLYDSNFKDVRNNTILSGEWEKIAKEHCSAKYAFVNKWRAENCPKLNAKTYWNYNYQCSSYINAQAAEKSAAASAQAEKDKAAAEAKIAATQAANQAATSKERAEGDAAMAANALSFATPFNKLFKELTDLVEGTAESNYAMGTQQDIEAKINQLQSYWSNPDAKGKFTASNADATLPYSVQKALKFIPKLIQTAKTKYPSMTATFVK
jgi:hypothetical protein